MPRRLTPSNFRKGSCIEIQVSNRVKVGNRREGQAGCLERVAASSTFSTSSVRTTSTDWIRGMTRASARHGADQHGADHARLETGSAARSRASSLERRPERCGHVPPVQTAVCQRTATHRASGNHGLSDRGTLFEEVNREGPGGASRPRQYAKKRGRATRGDDQWRLNRSGSRG
jgi:hypothetical protein